MTVQKLPLPSQIKMIKVILFEDNKNLRDSLSMYLSSVDNILFAGSYPDPRDAISIIKKIKPDVVLMDIEMPHLSGLAALYEIKKKLPQTKILIQTVFEDEDRIFQGICGGADGYIVKSPDPDRYVKAIEDVYAGGSHLSPNIAQKVLRLFQARMVKIQPQFVDLTAREKDVLNCLSTGMSYKLIADTCKISYTTVNSHIKNIYEKLQVNSASEAIIKAIEMRLV